MAGFVVVMAVLIPVFTGVALSFLSYVLGAGAVGDGRVRGHDGGHHGQRPHRQRGHRRSGQGPCRWPSGAGAVMGFAVAGLSLLGLALTYLLFVEWIGTDDGFEIFTAFGLGASSIALFSRVGGGIYTKAADVGADLVGKVEGRHPRGTTPATRPPSPTTWATTWATWPAWAPTCSRATRARSSRRWPSPPSRWASPPTT